ncbi:MAG TPA: hypothetical protein VGC84_12915 [Ilumatobacteraceae bacterium]
MQFFDGDRLLGTEQRTNTGDIRKNGHPYQPDKPESEHRVTPIKRS